VRLGITLFQKVSCVKSEGASTFAVVINDIDLQTNDQFPLAFLFRPLTDREEGAFVVAIGKNTKQNEKDRSDRTVGMF
jgi:hypothetical protein